jgi:hypothetical protein
LKGADSIELKLTIPESECRSALAALGIDPLQAQMHQVYFSDTPELTLNGAGVVVEPAGSRARGRLGGEAAAGHPRAAPDSLRKSPTWWSKVDAIPGSTYVGSASLKPPSHQL